MKATAQDFATCKECLEDFHTEDMVWGDKGAFYWLCERCAYIQAHIQEEHDYSYATDERPYDLCLYCDCRRMANEDAWQVGN